MFLRVSAFAFSTKQVAPLTKMSHLRLNFKDFALKLPLIQQNVKNRNAASKYTSF